MMTKNGDHSALYFLGTQVFLEWARLPSGPTEPDDPGAVTIACVQLPPDIADAFEGFVTSDRKRKRPAMVKEYLSTLSVFLATGGSTLTKPRAKRQPALVQAMAPHVTAFGRVFERMLTVEDFLRAKGFDCPLRWDLVSTSWTGQKAEDLRPFHNYFMAVRACWFVGSLFESDGYGEYEGPESFVVGHAQNFVTRMMLNAMTAHPKAP